MPEIIVDITPAGSVKIDANGFVGEGCAAATEKLELVLGGGQKKQDKKPEYYAPATTQNVNHNTF
jgi:hypothetical protein